jgi:hypothetical protein
MERTVPLPGFPMEFQRESLSLIAKREEKMNQILGGVRVIRTEVGEDCWKVTELFLNFVKDRSIRGIDPSKGNGKLSVEICGCVSFSVEIVED